MFQGKVFIADKRGQPEVSGRIQSRERKQLTEHGQQTSPDPEGSRSKAERGGHREEYERETENVGTREDQEREHGL